MLKNHLQSIFQHLYAKIFKTFFVSNVLVKSFNQKKKKAKTNCFIFAFYEKYYCRENNGA